ncbi:uncharacterized protein LOC131981390 [Centropristis striata]|uniref:uncharacterized protein LOC131981390 n=1 Tax=Centropristis striata TaxID=184440 RepID=UPI0027E165BB|nr:uncharacterized protein LOC131981390 [Centropristis striata]
MGHYRWFQQTIVLWVTLLLLHQGYTLIPVTTVQLGEPATFTWKTQKTSNYTVVQPPASDPVRAGAPMTLQCSVLSDSETKTCPGDHSVFWFRAGTKESHPNIIYTDGRTSNECSELIFLLCVVQALSLIVIICLIYALKIKESDCYNGYNAAVAMHKHRSGQQRDEDAQFYSAVVFTVMKTGCDAMKEKNAAEKQRIYAAVKAFGLD